MLVVIDYGVSNIGSLINMLRKIGAAATVTHQAEVIQQASKIILPGIGAFDAGMSRLTELGLIGHLNRKVVEEKIPTLGICLGMQLMAKKSEEGTLAGLSWFDAEVVKFRFDRPDVRLKVPHMGWNFIDVKKPGSLFSDMTAVRKFYFVHSYHVKVNDASDVLATTYYGYPFASAIEKGNIAGVQFHPEKSHRFGFELLKNFVERF